MIRASVPTLIMKMWIQAIQRAAETSPSPVSAPPATSILALAPPAIRSAAIAAKTGQTNQALMDRTRASTADGSVWGRKPNPAGAGGGTIGGGGGSGW